LVAVFAAVLSLMPVAGAQTDEVAPQAIDADAVTDRVGLVDPVTGAWHLRGQGGAISSFFYGNPGDVPFMGDWNCDGVSTPGLYRQSDGFVYLRNSNSQGIADIRFFFGNPGDYPLAGDFDNDGCDTVSIYRASEARIYIINELGANDGGLGAADFNYIFGNPGDKPFVGDFDGNGEDTVGLHRESTGFMYFRNSHTQGIADAEFFFGDPGDRLVAGDWGIVDGIDTPGVFRPSNTTFFFRHSNTQGVADESIFWGQSNFLPVAGRFNVTGGGGGGGGGTPPPPPGPFCSDVTGITQADCEALLVFYAATGGPNWTNPGTWASSKTPCTWPGVTCTSNRVTSLILSPAEAPFVGNLTGSIPGAIGALSALQVIDFASNEMSGSIPPDFGSLSNLQALDLSGNNLTGAIPANLGFLTNLTVELDLHFNLLTGPIPTSFAALDSLLILDLGENNLSGDLTVLGEMASLDIIDLRQNAFSGVVPGEIGNLLNLSRLDLSANLPGFTSIGSGFGDALNLTDIDLSNNRLDGAISSEFLGLTQLTELDLSFNQLDGEIPDGITGLTLLEALDLSSNTINDMEVPNFTTMPGFTPTPPDVIAGELLLVPNTCIGTSNPAVAALILAHNPGWVDCNPA
jgi:hypothetical protein